MLKKSVSPSGDLTIDLVFLYNIIIALTVSFGMPYAYSIFYIFCRLIESKALEKSMKSKINGRFFDFAPTIMRNVM